MRRSVWRTRLGFYLAAIGSAVGLGNLWRFPYVVSNNGGGAFVLLYIFLVFLIGMPLLVGELLIGKSTRRSLLSAVEELRLERQKALGSHSAQGFCFFTWCCPIFPWMARLALFVTALILSYFSVVSGWVLHFVMQFLVGPFTPEGVQPEASLAVLMNNGWLQILLTSAHLLLVGVVVAKGVHEGIERWVGYMAPAFGLLLIVLVAKTLSLDATPEALRYFFYPDFSKLNMASLGQALGHVLFTLSIGFGVMVTLGSYLRDKSYLPISGFRVATADSFVSLIAGLLLFPLVVTGDFKSYGPELLFQAIPGFLINLKGGWLFGLGFFLFLYLAALGASIVLFETLVANAADSYRMPRSRGASLVGIGCLLLAIPSALSSSVLKNFQFEGLGFLALLDSVLVNWMLPLVALFISQLVYRLVSDHVKKTEFTHPVEFQSSIKLYGHWMVVLKWIAPTVILLALGLQVISLFAN